MFRTAILGLFLSVASVLAAPAPFLVKKKPPLRQLQGTVWLGDGVVGKTTYSFLPGGKMKYSYGGRTFTTGKWRQDGKKISWDMNNRYCWFEGAFDGEEMQGVARNKPGGRWELKMKLVPNSPAR